MLVLAGMNSFGQDSSEVKGKGCYGCTKRQVYFSWGWNRAKYTKSNLYLSGSDHDFVIRDMTAEDHPTPFSFNKYLNPVYATIPQFNVAVGVQWKKNLWLSFGYDHMKYFMVRDQEAVVDGYIDTGSRYDGIYDNQDQVIEYHFLLFEHSDGLNYLNLELKYEHELYKKGMFAASAFGGGGPAMIITRTDVRLLDYENRNVFHVTGYGAGATGGLKFLFWNRIFVRPELKTGWINIVGVRTTNRSRQDWAHHNFGYMQYFFTLGYEWGM